MRALEAVARGIGAMPVSCDWLLIGSAAMAAQGCRIEPKDIDIAVPQPGDLENIMHAFHGDLPARGMADPQDMEHWLSSAECPVAQFTDPLGFDWHFARWHLGAIEIEVACIRAPMGHIPDRILEFACPDPRHVIIGSAEVAVPPLEVQLRTNIDRGRQERVAEILRVLRSMGYDRDLLAKALTPPQLLAIEAMLRAS